MQIHHYSVRTNDMEAVRQFFCDVAELEPGDRPPFQFPGYWLYDVASNHPVVHVIGIDGDLSDDTGAFDHLAFDGDGERFDTIAEKIESLPYPHEKRIVPGRGLRQIFVTGPHGIKVELNFPPEP